MANNPLFPGYVSDKPDKQQINPMFPGYFPGAPIQKKPIYPVLTPLTYDADIAFKYIDDEAEHVTGGPEWIKDKIIKDWKDNFKASYKPDDISVEQLNDYDADALPGVASAQISLNPEDWKNPGEQAEKTVKTWVTSVTGVKFDKYSWMPNGFNTEDYENRVQTAIWGNVLGITDETSGGYLLREASKATAENTRAWHSDFKNTGPQPFKLTDSGIISDFSKTDSYAAVASSMVDFERYNGAENQKRDSKHDSMLVNTVKAMDDELNGYTTTARDNTTSVVSHRHNDVLAAVAPADRAATEDALKYFKLQRSVVDNMESTKRTYAGALGITTHLEKEMAGASRWDATNPSGPAYVKVTADPAKALDAIRGNLHGTLNTTTGAMEGGLDQFIAQAHAISPAAGKAMENSVAEYKKYLTNLENTLQTSIANKDSKAVMLYKIKNTTSGDARMRTLSGGNVLTGNIQRTYVEGIQQQILRPGLNTAVPRELQIGTVLKNGSISAMPDLYANRTRILLSRMVTEQNANRITEVVGAMSDGKFMERYVWNTISTKITGYTPAAITEAVMKKVNYFGFVIDENYDPSSNFTRNLYNNDVFKNHFNLKVNGVTNKIYGANELTGALTLMEYLDMKKLDITDIQSLLNGSVNLTSGSAAAKAILDKLPASASAKLLQANITNFRAWLDSADNKFGIKSTDNINDLVSLMRALQKENSHSATFGITARYAGFIQKWGVFLGKLQDQIYDRFGIALKPLFQLKTYISQQISAMISKALVAGITKILVLLGAAATGGALEFIGPLIEKILAPLIRAVFDKATSYFKTFFVEMLLHGNWDAVIKQMEKEIEGVLKFILRGFAIFIVVTVLPAAILWGSVLSVLSPIDPTKSNVGYDGLTTMENPYMTVTKDVTVGGQTNPREPLSNDALPLTAHYTITITAKQDLPAMTGTDIAKILQAGASARTLINMNNISIPAILAGESYEVTGIPDINLTASDKDSAIYNTFTATLPAEFAASNNSASAFRSFSVGKPPFDINCFEFHVRSGEEDSFISAATALGNVSGGYLPRLCAKVGKIIVTRNSEPACGLSTRPNFINFGDGGCASGGYYANTPQGHKLLNYLFAHETGHIYNYNVLNYSNPADGGDALHWPQGFDNVKALDGGRQLPTYDIAYTGYGDCGKQPEWEDFADSVGDYVQNNPASKCHESRGAENPYDYNAFWALYPEHKRYVEQVLFAP